MCLIPGQSPFPRSWERRQSRLYLVTLPDSPELVISSFSSCLEGSEVHTALCWKKVALRRARRSPYRGNNCARTSINILMEASLTICPSAVCLACKSPLGTSPISPRVPFESILSLVLERQKRRQKDSIFDVLCEGDTFFLPFFLHALSY